jgi:putative oxidoreductase
MVRRVALTTSLDRVLVRWAVSAMMIVHGVSRTLHGTVDDFGGWLGSRGLPFGVAIAWTLTVVEIVGGLTLAAGRLVRPLCMWFFVQLGVGILMVHWPEGWWVVGAGRGGMEYSVLLMSCLFAIALGEWSRSTGRG